MTQRSLEESWRSENLYSFTLDSAYINLCLIFLFTHPEKNLWKILFFALLIFDVVVWALIKNLKIAVRPEKVWVLFPMDVLLGSEIKKHL